MFPPSWREATVVASQELGKASTDPNNYRPIALTSCLCKTMERMLNNWLMWVPECKGLLASDQCGFISLGSLQIIWFVLIVTFVTLLLPPPPNNMLLTFSLIWKKFTPRGSTVYYLIFTNLIFEAICLTSLFGFCPIDCSR